MNRIPGTHVGSLVRPPELLRFLAASERGESYDEAAYAETLRKSVKDVVDKQLDVGVDIVDDGEMGKASWITYLYERVSGLEARVMTLDGASMMPPSRDRQQFPGAYAALDALDEAAVRDSNAASESGSDSGSGSRSSSGSGSGSGEQETTESNQAIEWACTGPIEYDRTALDRDIANFRSALEGHDGVEAFMPVVAPASAYWLRNEHYESDEEFVYALADALSEEYHAIVDAGFMLQVDDAVLMHERDSMLSEGKGDEDYLEWAQLRVDALNHALRGLPPDRVRYHVCWGSWHGPHAYDPPLKDEVDLILQVNAGYYAMEQANPRHEHEWRVWEDVPLPDGKKLIPGVVTHHTNVIEHPELVAQRLVRLAGVVGRENVLAGTDCGFAQGAFIRRVHEEIQWAKLGALVEGARLASRELWGAQADD